MKPGGGVRKKKNGPVYLFFFFNAGTVRIRAFMADFRTRHLENKAEL